MSDYHTGYEEGYHDGLAIGRKSAETRRCVWEKGSYGEYMTACGHVHVEDLYSFCPYCGHRLGLKGFEVEDE